MSDDTDDVDSSSGSGAVGTGNDDRLAKLAAISAKNDREAADQFAEVHDDDSTSPFELEDEAGVPKTPEEEAPEVKEPEEESPAEEEVAPPTKFKIKVNGKELELTQEELIARAQKVESADQYLADAARRRKELEPPAPTGPTAEELQRQRDEEDARIVRAIQMGTEEEALAAVKLLSSRNAQRPSVSPDDMSRAIDERLAFNEAITKFRTDFSDIAGDPLLYSLAQQRDIQLVEANDTRPYAERYEAIGKELRAWKESLAPAPKKDDPVVDTSLADKKARKELAPKIPTAATKKVAKVEEEDDNAEEDAHSVIANIAKARGGPQWMRG